MAHEYPTFFEAYSAARNLRSIVGTRSFGPGFRAIANDLWTLQGYAQAYIIGRPTYNAFENTQPSFPRYTDGENVGALDALLNCTTPEGNLRPGYVAESIDWTVIYAWCLTTLTRLVLQVG